MNPNDPQNPYTPSPPSQTEPMPVQQVPAKPQDKQEIKQELRRAIQNSKQILAQATTVFPFTLFPDTVTIDRSQVTIVHRSFLKLGDVVSIRIEDVLNVEATVGPFFGSLSISTRFFNTSQDEKHYKVHWLWRHDALHIKRILHGYMTAVKQHIDCSRLETRELTQLLNSLGDGITHDET
jgi:hypothetical protein